MIEVSEPAPDSHVLWLRSLEESPKSIEKTFKVYLEQVAPGQEAIVKKRAVAYSNFPITRTPLVWTTPVVSLAFPVHSEVKKPV